MTIGRHIQAARKKAKFTQKELAEACGLATGTIQQYELGKRQPRLGQLQAIAAALGISVSELVGEDYWEKRYPGIVDNSKENEGFINYLNTLGYSVEDLHYPSKIPIEEFKKVGKMDLVPKECMKAGFVVGESHSVKIIKDGKSFILEEDEFKDLQKSTRDVIALKLWQKSQEKK